MVFACVDKVDLDTATEVSSDYLPPDPTEEMVEWLQNTPVQMPFQRCTPYTDDMDIQLDSLVQSKMVPCKSAFGIASQVCRGHHLQILTREGSGPGPSWIYHPESLFDRMTVYDDADYMAELDWVRSQGKSSGCACCPVPDDGLCQ